MQRLCASLLLLLPLGCGADQPEPAQTNASSREAAPGQADADPKQDAAVQPVQDPVATGLRSKPIFTAAIRSLTFSPDGKWLAVGDGRGMVEIWDIESRKRLHQTKGHEKWTFDVAFAPDGKLLYSGGGDHLILGWDPASMARQTEFRGHQDDVHGVAVSPDGKTLYSGADDTKVIAWEIASGKQIWSGSHAEQVTSVVVSPDGRFVASGSRDDTVRIWRLDNGGPVATLSAHEGDVLSVAFSPDSTLLASASYDKTARLHSVESWESRHTLTAHANWVFCVAISPDGAFVVSGDGDGRLLLSRTDGERADSAKLDSDVADVAFSPVAALLAAGTSSGAIELYEIADGKLKHVHTLQKPQVPAAPAQPMAAAPVSLKEYADLTWLATQPEMKGWFDAVAKLGETGDEYSADVLRELYTTNMSVTEFEIVSRSIAAIEARSPRTPEQIAAGVQRRLEQAAYCDLTCHFLEGKLIRATTESIKQHAADPTVRGELQRIAEAYVPSASDSTIDAESMQKRVRAYARQILDPNAPAPQATK